MKYSQETLCLVHAEQRGLRSSHCSIGIKMSAKMAIALAASKGTEDHLEAFVTEAGMTKGCVFVLLERQVQGG